MTTTGTLEADRGIYTRRPLRCSCCGEQPPKPANLRVYAGRWLCTVRRAEDRRVESCYDKAVRQAREDLQAAKKRTQSGVDRLGTDARMMAMAEADPDWSPHGSAFHLVRDFCNSEEAITHKPLAPDGTPRWSPGIETRIFGREVVRVGPKPYISTRELALILGKDQQTVRRAIDGNTLKAVQFTTGDGRYDIEVLEAKRYINALALSEETKAIMLVNLSRMVGEPLPNTENSTERSA